MPGGGWVKQGWTDLSRATYAKTISIPMFSADQVTRLNFGAINHRATVTVDGRTVGTQTTSFTNSVFDLTGFVTPGAEHRIEVTVEGRKALVGPDLRYTVPEGASWSDDVAQGIFRSANLEVFPAVFVADTFVRTSVTDKTLSYDVQVTNSTDRAQKVDLTGALSSWNGQGWKYPAVPTQHAVVPANTTATITVGPLRWRADEGSYWTPNVPYQADYTAQLHELGVSITSRPDGGGKDSGGPKSTSEYGVRFGFRELKQVGDHFELNGVKVNFRGDSLQGANYDNIDHFGISDAYDTLPGFLEPSDGNGGWPQAVRNYQRLNYNSVRIHQLPATPYMLDVADELGLMIQDETAIRGSNDRENFVAGGGRDNMVKHLVRPRAARPQPRFGVALEPGERAARWTSSTSSGCLRQPRRRPGVRRAALPDRDGARHHAAHRHRWGLRRPGARQLHRVLPLRGRHRDSSPSASTPRTSATSRASRTAKASSSGTTTTRLRA